MPSNFAQLMNLFIGTVKAAIPLVAFLALLVFFWGLAKFISNVSGDAKAVDQGKSLMVWGTVALFVMVSIWGILRFLQGELGLGTLGVPFLPTP